MKMKNLVLCKALTFVRYFAEALFFPFISLYLKDQGLDISHIGIIIAAIPITSMICAPIYSKICTNPHKTKIALMIMSFIEAFCIILFLFVNSFAYALGIIIIMSIVSSSNYGMIDSLLTLIAEDHKQRYSSIRIYGSISYMLGVLISGLITKAFGFVAAFSVTCAIFLGVSILYFFIKTPNRKEETKQEGTGIHVLFSNKAFLFYLVFYVLWIGTMQVGDDFFSLYMESKGGKEYYSYVMFGFIAIEIATMLLLNRFGNRFGIKIYFVALVLLVIRNLAHAIPNMPLWFIIAFQMTRGVIWATALYLSSTLISKILGYRLASSGIILVLFGVQVFNSIFKFCGGYIIEAIGYSSFYFILFCISLIAFFYFIFYYKAYRGLILNQEKQ